MMRKLIVSVALLGVVGLAVAAPLVDALHGEIAIDQNDAAPPIAQERNKDMREKRSYPMQPPIIPHSIENYQIDINSNKCISCHDREKAVEKKAPMVSVTHYMDRDGQFLAEVSPRRYFCTQCHVPQHEVSPAVTNTFVDSATLLRGGNGMGSSP
jgi:cytochrome c-type protein NapB